MKVRETPMHLQIYGKNKSGEALWIKCGRLNFPNNVTRTAVEWAAEGRKSAKLEANEKNYYG